MFFAGAAFAEKQHAKVAVRDVVELSQDDRHARARGHDLAELRDRDRPGSAAGDCSGNAWGAGCRGAASGSVAPRGGVPTRSTVARSSSTKGGVVAAHEQAHGVVALNAKARRGRTPPSSAGRNAYGTPSSSRTPAAARDRDRRRRC